MKYRVNIMLNTECNFRTKEIEIPENILCIQTLYMYLKEKFKLPNPKEGEICICCKDVNRVVTLFVISEKETVLYSSFEDINIFTSMNTLYISYCNPTARAEEIFLMNEGSHYYMWHDGYEEEYSKYGITKKQEGEWMQKHHLSPKIR